MTALVLLLVLAGAGGSKDAAASPEVPKDETAFTYDLYCDAQGRFTYDGAALKLVRRPAHLERVYAEAGRGEARAKEVVRELEFWFHQAGVVVADTTTRPACLPLPEMTPECQPNWQFLTELLGHTREAERLRQVVAHAYQVRAQERGLRNKVILAGVNLLVAGAVVKGRMTPAAPAEVQGAQGSLGAEIRTAQTETLAAGRSGVAARSIAPSSRALGQALEAAGVARPAGSAAHHLIAGNAPAAAQARAVLQRFGIGINDAANGVFLPATRAAPNAADAAVHSTIHTNAYYQTVNQMLGAATTRAEAEAALQAIRQSLLSGSL